MTEWFSWLWTWWGILTGLAVVIGMGLAAYFFAIPFLKGLIESSTAKAAGISVVRAITTLLVVASLFYFVGGWGALAVLFTFVVMMICFIFAAWQLAKQNVFFTFVGVGQIKTVDRGENNLINAVANVPGFRVSNDLKIVEEADRKNFLEKNFGLFWIGIPPAKVHTFEFVHERANPKITKDTPVEEWIDRDKVAKQSDYILWEIPHSYLILGAELQDNFKVDMLVETRSRTIDPKVALYLREGKFIDYMRQFVEASVNVAVRKYTIEEFRSMDKLENSELAQKIRDGVNSVQVEGLGGLLYAVGMETISAFVSKWDSSDKSDEESLHLRKKAKLAGEAAIEAAERAAEQAVHDGKKIVTLATAQRDADVLRAEGRAADLSQALKAIKAEASGVDSNVAVRHASAVTIATKMSDKDSPVRVLGGGAGVMVGLEPEKEK